VLHRAGIYFCCNMILIAVTSVVSVVIVNISNLDQEKPVPLWARKVCYTSCFLPLIVTVTP